MESAQREPARLRISAARNVLSNWVGFLFSALVAFFLSPFIVHHLGNSVYGLWILVGSLTGYLGLLELGVRGAVTRYVAKFYAQSNHGESSRVVSVALLIFLAAGVLAISVSFMLALFVVGRFHVPAAYEPAARLILVLLGLNVAVSLVSGVFGAVLVGLHRFDLCNAIEMTSTAFRAVVIVIGLSRGKGLVALALIHLIFAIATGLAYALTAFRLYPELKVGLTKCDGEHLRLIFSFGAYAFLLDLSTSLVYYSDSVVIGLFLPVSAVTFFVIAANLMNYSRALINGISATVTPLVSALEARGQVGELQGVLLKGARYATLVVLPIALTFMIRGASFIGIWMGPEYRVLSGHVLWILALALVFGAGNQAAASTMLGLSKHKSVVPVVLVEAVCNLGLSIALVRPMGIIGVAWGTVLPNLAVSFLFWPRYVCRTLGVPIRAYVVSTWARPCLALVPFAFCSYAIERLQPASNLPSFFLQVGISLPLAALGAWYVALAPADRQQLGEKLSRPISKALRWTSR